MIAKTNYGTEQVKAMLSRLFQSFPLDRDGDGQINFAEWGETAWKIIPGLMDKSLYNEAKDLTRAEVKELAVWAQVTFPQLAGLEEKIEDLVVAIFLLINAVVQVWEAFDNLHHEDTPPVGLADASLLIAEVPSFTPPAPFTGDPKVRPGATKSESPKTEAAE